MSKFRPREYQSAIISHIVSTKRAIVWAGMGTGKTSSTLFALNYLKAIGEPIKALVIAPLRVAASTWPDEVEKWQEDLDLSIKTLCNLSPKAREKALNIETDVTSINYEGLGWLCDTVGKNWDYNVIIADESTKLKGFRLGGGGGKRSKALSKVAFIADRFIELTGTPSPNGLIDLWGQLYFIDRGQRLGRSFSAFIDMFFTRKQVGRNAFAVEYIPCSWAQGKIQDKLKDVCVTIRAEDYFNIEQPIVNNIYIDLPEKSKKVYESLETEMYAELESGAEITAAQAGVKSMKCLQLASGALYTDDQHSYEVLHDEKIKALDSVIEEAAGAPVLVAYTWKSDLERLKKAYPQARILDQDPQTIKDWNKGKIQLLLAHPASSGHGLNLQDGGHILVFFSLWWNLEHYQQIVERIGPTRQLQAGHPRPVFIYHIIARETVDQLVLERLETKKTVQEILLENMKKAKNEKVNS